MAKSESLVEEEEEEMVAPAEDGVPTRRTGRFLKPRASSVAAALPPVPSLRNALSGGYISWPPKKVVLEGWRYPQPKWKEWVDRLRPIYQDVWRKAGIFDAVIASTYEIRRHPSVFFALLLYWCPDTNTFAFPWSEVTLTLEDVMILGGFSVLGEPVKMKESLSGELGEMLTKMIAERKGFNKLSSKKASHYEWIKHYMDVGKADELEHIAFLSLWLSRFVFPAHPGKTVSEVMFPIAIRLAQGTRIALAPAVLASIYRDLRVLRDYVVGNGVEEMLANFTVWAPFQLLQVWAWEHFVALRIETCPNFLKTDEPRASRWHGLDVKLELLYVVSVLESQEEFQWRPYMTRLDDWRPPSFYRDDGQWICISLDKDDGDMRAYVHIMRPCELVGIDCIEQYLPHRVAMQFGLDQDLPGCVRRMNINWELAWRTYDKDVEDIKLYVPPRLFESDCTKRFFSWQQECWFAHSKTGENFIGQLEQSQQEKHMALQQERHMALQQERHMALQQENQKNVHMSLDEKGIKLENQTDLLPANEIVHDDNAAKHGNGSVHKSISPASYEQKQHLSKNERKMSRKRRLSKIYAAKLRHGDALHQLNDVKVMRTGEAYPGEFFNIEIKGTANDVKKNAIGSFYVPKTVEDIEGTFSPSYNSLRMKEREQKAARLQKEMELDAQIEKIKAEIFKLQADVMNMDSRNEFEGLILSTI